MVFGEEFYRFLGSAIPETPAMLRQFVGFDLIVTAGGQEMVDFLQIARANTGITSSQVIPVYSNLSEGRGIFSSRAVLERTGLILNSTSMDSLRDGRFTRQLNFQ